MLFCLPFILRAFISYEQMACDSLSSTGKQFLISGTLDNKTCLLSVLFSYYFLIAANIWWLMLTYLSAARKWVQEGIDACSSYLHLIAWALPALLTIAVFVTHKVDASELTGICSVGNTNPWSLLGFVIIPKFLFVLLGSCFIIAGFASMCRERDSFRRRGTDTSKLEKLMVKMGIFSAFYIIPAVVMVVCDCYHMFILLKWHSASIACKMYSTPDNNLCRNPEKLPSPQATRVV
uniref:G_PROTEIN_RECEP_F2_4 domain-containing protein n=1 Tax=Syphacia muris TaxID=451379 RepID=A0A0N5AFN4_9BILA